MPINDVIGNILDVDSDLITKLALWVSNNLIILVEAEYSSRLLFLGVLPFDLRARFFIA